MSHDIEKEDCRLCNRYRHGHCSLLLPEPKGKCFHFFLDERASKKRAEDIAAILTMLRED